MLRSSYFDLKNFNGGLGYSALIRLRSYHPDQACGYLAIPGRGELLLRASAIEGDVPSELAEGWQIEVEVGGSLIVGSPV